MSKSKLYDLAEKSFGFSISEIEFEEAEFLARNKLNHILSREGSADGARLDPRYLAELIAEYVQIARFQVFIEDRNCMIEEQREKKRVLI